ncbi:hypothetical protein [Natrononativus amylolyticus]|uniref:hypothetical protein n=1 Tax=Natrononativus amylolyticus TaxID=2963434 RepID=UPI0020CCB26E|nr:hypothetical protein [Natrononativus amylolyticus]
MPPYVEPIKVEKQLPFGAESFSNVGEDTWDSLLTQLINDAVDDIHEWTNTRFEPTETNVILSGDDTKRDRRDLILAKRPIRSVESVAVDGGVLDEGAYRVLDTHLVRVDGRWPRGQYNIDVEYTYGYDDVPGAVRNGIVRLVRSVLEQIPTDGLSQESSGDASYTYRPPGEIRATVAAEVQQYRPDSYYSGARLI